MPNHNDNFDQNYQKALQDSLERARRAGDSEDCGRILIDLGRYLAKHLHFDQAASCFSEAMEALHPKAADVSLIPVFFEWAKIERVLKHDEKAFALYQKVIEFSEQTGQKSSLGMAFAFKGDILIEQGAQRNGLEWMFRGLDALENAGAGEKDHVLRWIQKHKQKIPAELFKRVVHQAVLAPRTKELLKSIV